MQTRRSTHARLLLLAVLASLHSRGASATSWNVSCCRVFEALTKFTVERTGSSLSGAECRSDERQCLNLKLIVVFLEQSRTLVGRHNVETSTEHNFIHFHLERGINDDETRVLDLLAWAFVGRIVALPTMTRDVNQRSVVLQYDVQGDQLSITRDSCQVDKALYNTMVLGSVTLLIFFISAMVVEKKRHEQEHPAAPQTPGREAASLLPRPELDAKVSSLMRPAHIFGPLVPPSPAFRF